MGSNPGTLYQAAENFLVGAEAPARGRCFVNFCYGGVEGEPPAAAPVPTGFGFQEIPDFMGTQKDTHCPPPTPLRWLLAAAKQVHLQQAMAH